jgi:hypothetical protein
VQEFLQKSEQFRREQSLDRNKFAQARAAFWSGTPDATMAIAIAVTQAIFILILKFLSEIFSYKVKPRANVRLDAPLETRLMVREFARPSRSECQALQGAAWALFERMAGTSVQDIDGLNHNGSSPGSAGEAAKV